MARIAVYDITHECQSIRDLVRDPPTTRSKGVYENPYGDMNVVSGIHVDGCPYWPRFSHAPCVLAAEMVSFLSRLLL